MDETELAVASKVALPLDEEAEQLRHDLGIRPCLGQRQAFRLGRELARADSEVESLPAVLNTCSEKLPRDEPMSDAFVCMTGMNQGSNIIVESFYKDQLLSDKPQVLGAER